MVQGNLTQSQQVSPAGDRQEFIDQMRRVLESIDDLDLGAEERDELRDEAEDAIAAVDNNEKTDAVLPAKAKRRGLKVAEFLRTAAAGATGTITANEILHVLQPLLN